MRRSVPRCVRYHVLLYVIVLIAGCAGDEGGDRSGTRTERPTALEKPGESGTLAARACELVPLRAVAAATGARAAELEAEPNDSLDLSICGWSGGPVTHIKLLLDSAPRAQLRYYNLLAEQLEFHNADPARKPRQIRGVGQDTAYGGAGAWWTRATRQLVVYDRERILKLRVNVRGFEDAEARAAAVAIGRRAVRRLRVVAGR